MPASCVMLAEMMLAAWDGSAGQREALRTATASLGKPAGKSSVVPCLRALHSAVLLGTTSVFGFGSLVLFDFVLRSVFGLGSSALVLFGFSSVFGLGAFCGSFGCGFSASVLVEVLRPFCLGVSHHRCLRGKLWLSSWNV